MSTNSEMDAESDCEISYESEVSGDDFVPGGIPVRRGGRTRRGGRRGGRAGRDTESVRGRGGRRGRRGRRGRGGIATGRGRGAVSTVAAAETDDARKERVKGLVTDLSESMAKEVLCMVIDRQPGVILDILDRIEPAQPAGFHPAAGGNSPSWCSCDRCRDMPTVQERVCCGYTPDYCLSQLPDIENYILDEGVLSLARLYRREILVYPDERDLGKANRHAAYRQFVLWNHGRLGQGRRVVIPSCCVWIIRDKYPDPYGQYAGFQPARLG